MRSASKARARLGALLAAVVLLGVLRAWTSALQAAPAPAGGPGEGAGAELARARREQALMRAESTAAMLRALNSASTLPEGGP
jgi:hypothetical protein